jgi:hypothetical protein
VEGSGINQSVSIATKRQSVVKRGKDLLRSIESNEAGDETATLIIRSPKMVASNSMTMHRKAQSGSTPGDASNYSRNNQGASSLQALKPVLN